MKKKFFLCLFVLVLSFMLMACGNSEVGSSSDNNAEKENNSTDTHNDGNNNVSNDSTPEPTSKPTETPSPTPTPEPLEVGEKIMFGSFDQEYFYSEDGTYTGNTGGKHYLTDGVKDDITWKILMLSEDGNKALIISDNALAFRPYNDTLADITWEQCSLRKWLNEDFYNEAFSDNERASIAETQVANTDNEKHGTTGGNDTVDKVYCLSLEEELSFFGGKVGAYNKKAVAKDINGKTSMWWLRGSGNHSNRALYITAAGLAEYGGTEVDGSEKAKSGFMVGVRPVMWVYVSALHK